MTTAIDDRATRLPLSFNQELLCMFDSGDGTGPFGPRYHAVVGRRLTGPVDPEILRAALADVVRRHEPLRTLLVRGPGERYQQVFPPSAPSLELRECPGCPPGERAHRAEEVLSEVEAGGIRPDELPLLRAVLMRFDEQDAVLVLMTHHLATDGWSMGLIVRDLATYYAARKAGAVAEPPPLAPYREFLAWEREQAATGSAAAGLAYWRGALAGGRLTAVRADHRRSAGLPPVTSAYRFRIEAELLAGVQRLAKTARCSPFMVLLSAYHQLLHQLTGVTDLVVPTHTLGRARRFVNTVGSFFNFLPIRTDLAGCRDVPDLLARTRTACLAAFEHEIPSVRLFETAPELMAPAMQDELAPVTFQALPALVSPEPPLPGDITYTIAARQAALLPVTSDIPDGAVWSISLDPASGWAGCISYRADRFDRQTIVELADAYRTTLRGLLAGADHPVFAA